MATDNEMHGSKGSAPEPAPRVDYYDPDFRGPLLGEWVPAAPLPLYPEHVPAWWKRALARLLWPVIGRGCEKPMWMEKK